MKKINLDKIIINVANINKDEDGNRIFYFWEVKKAMKETCEQVLELAAEKVHNSISDLEYHSENERLQESILDIINQIE